jgi:hypothetical protein
MRQTPGHRLFQSDGYSFIRWVADAEIHHMLASGELKPCVDPRTNKTIGFQLKKENTDISAEVLLPLGRVYNPLLQPHSLHYEIPHAGDCRTICLRRFSMRRFGRADGKKQLGPLGRRIIKVSGRKLDFTQPPLSMTRTRALSIPNVPSVLNSSISA